MQVLQRRFWTLLVLVAGCCALARPCLGADDRPGRTLFVERWASHDKRSPDGDGLGPMHNATSCAACHHQSGPGGGGDRGHNVELLSVVPVDRRLAAERHFANQLIALHPGFRINAANRPLVEIRPNIVLHRFGPEADYFDFRARLLGVEEPRADVDPTQRAVAAAALARRHSKNSAHVKMLEPVDGIKLKLSERNTPALWGAGLIDAISEAAVEEYAKVQKHDAPNVAGRVPVANEGGLGRFGWRGQTSTLRAFVLGACANEMGLETKEHRQAINPLNPDYRPKGTDMLETDMIALVSFVGSLPPPVEAEPTSSFEAESVRKGERVFERIGCGDCHPRQLAHVNGLFSDLLLHDMGHDLSDPVEPNPDVKTVERLVGTYSGGGRVFVKSEEEIEDPTLPQQWRTPPLWGVADSAPYLHDGRAATLSEAIHQHGGQGSTSALKFRHLPRQDRVSLIAFLESLTAPRIEQ
jgi:CxxC motif-containing protein (DUF1111 family)